MKNLSLHTALRLPVDQPVFITWIATGLFIVIALFPAGMMIGQSFVIDGNLSLQSYLVLTEPRVLNLFIKSLGMAAGATALSILFGLPLALILTRTEFFGRRLCHLLYLVPLFIPPHIQAMAWIHLLGDTGIITPFIPAPASVFNLYSPAGAAVILFLSYCPILIFLVLTGLAEIDHRLEEAARLHSGFPRTLFKVTLPLISPYIISGAVFVFIFSFFNYGIPSMLRVPSFPVEIFTRFSAFYDEAGAVALAAPLFAIALILLIFQAVYMKNRSIATSPAADRKQLPRLISVNVRLTALYAYTMIVFMVFLPLAALLLQAGDWKSFQIAWHTSSGEIGSSLALSATAATAVTTIAYFLSVFINVHSTRWRQILNFLTLLPFAFPAALFAIGLIRLWNTPYTQFIYATSCILIFAYTARFIPFAIRIISSRLRQIPPGLREAAYLCESSWFKRLWYIDLPLVRKGLAACWIVIFILCMGELGATLLLIPPGNGAVALKVYTLMHYGAGQLVAALALILVGSNLLIASTLLIQPVRR